MNIFSKLVSRTITSFFYIAKPFLPYKPPKNLDHIEDIVDVLNEKHINSVLLVTDKSIRKFGLSTKLEERIVKNNISLTIYDDVLPNPTTVNVQEGLDVYLNNKCQTIIAFGGGSPIDCAKAIAARTPKPKKPIEKLKGTLKVRGKLPLLFAVPTTAGTGSEVTLTAVISDPVTHSKYTINDFKLVPDYAVLDPETTFTLPKHLTSTTGIDALTHAIEAFIGKSTSKTTRKQSIDAITLIFNNIRTAYNFPDNYAARKNMLIASNLAGKAFSMSYVGYVHAVAHTLGGKYNVPHGLANSILLPYVLRDYGKKIYKKLHTLAIAICASTKGDSHEEGAKKFLDSLDLLLKDLDIPTKVDCIKKEDIPTLAKIAAKEANHLYPVPVLMNAKELEKFYFMIREKI